MSWLLESNLYLANSSFLSFGQLPQLAARSQEDHSASTWVSSGAGGQELTTGLESSCHLPVVLSPCSSTGCPRQLGCPQQGSWGVWSWIPAPLGPGAQPRELGWLHLLPGVGVAWSSGRWYRPSKWAVICSKVLPLVSGTQNKVKRTPQMQKAEASQKAP